MSTPAARLAELTERDLALVQSGAEEEHVAAREALVASADPRDPAFRRAATAQALITASLTAQRDALRGQVRALQPGRAAVQAYARSAQV